MGLLDFLFDEEKKEQRKLEKLSKNLTNMYVQDSERKYAIQELHKMATPEAVEILMERFEDTAPNTTVDLEEKEYTYEVLVDLGETTDLDIAGMVTEHLAESEEKINWPLKVMKDLLDYQEMIEVVIELLGTCTQGYQQNPEKKQVLMLQSAELRSPELAEALIPFLADSNETIRFLAVDAVAHQEVDEVVEEPLRERLSEEDSLRVVRKVAELFSEHKDWKIPEEEQAEVEQAIPDEYGIHKEGHIYRRRI